MTTGNTMAPYVIIGEKAAEFIKSEAGFEGDLEEGREGDRLVNETRTIHGAVSPRVTCLDFIPEGGAAGQD